MEYIDLFKAADNAIVAAIARFLEQDTQIFREEIQKAAGAIQEVIREHNAVCSAEKRLEREGARADSGEVHKAEGNGKKRENRQNSELAGGKTEMQRRQTESANLLISVQKKDISQPNSSVDSDNDPDSDVERYVVFWDFRV